MSTNRYYTTFARFCTKRVSANPQNTAYTIGPEGKEIFTDNVPEVLWDQYVLFGDDDRWWTFGKLHNHRSGGSGGDCVMPDGTTSDLDVGGLASGIDVSGKSVAEVLTDIISPEFAPVWTPASVSFPSSFNKVYEVGEYTPSRSDIISAVTTSRAQAKSSASYIANGGTLSSVAATGSYGVKMSTRGDYTIGASASFNAGIDIVKTSKDKPTTITATTTNTLLAKGTPNVNIDPVTFFIKSITATASITLHATYRIKATTDRITALTVQPLTTATTVTLSMPAETSTIKHRFALPSTYTLRSIQILNPLSGQYEDYDRTLFRTSTTTHPLPDGTNHPYTLYTRNHGTNGATTFRISFTPA